MPRNKRCSKTRRRKRSHAKKMQQILYKCVFCASTTDKRADCRRAGRQSRSSQAVQYFLTASKGGSIEFSNSLWRRADPEELSGISSQNGKKENRHPTDFHCSKTPSVVGADRPAGRKEAGNDEAGRRKSGKTGDLLRGRWLRESQDIATSVSTNEFTDTSNSLGSSVDPVDPPDMRYYGLHNLGATCYLNAVLQTLFMTKQFREAVESLTLSDHLRSLFKMLKEATTDVGNELLTSLGITNKNEQQDAAEYFQKIVSLCNITEIYHGTLRDSTKCLKKGHKSESESPFVILPLALESRQSYSVMDGWNQFFKSSVLNGDNQLYCDDCDEKTDAETVCELVRYPEVLTLQLKRFYFDFNDMMYRKTNCTVEIPVELQVTQEFTYELYAIIEHRGSVKSGHYYTNIKSFEGGKWYHFDDSRVFQCDPKIYNEKTIKSDYAYMLMYTKRPGGKEHTQGAEGDAGAGGQGGADRCIISGLAGDNLNATRGVRVKNYVIAENAGDSVSGESFTDGVSETVQHAVKATRNAQRQHKCASRNTGSKQQLKNNGKAGHEDRVDDVPFNKAGNRDYHTQY
ncbi:ubiquitin carboxyl-terminal hydrolase 47-like [Brienomyrus brachyistius]|uniref:ubiquitin carboxyl-terminal hydrolase 47-like n=1 Tax=Brienomyrus brachyistius TaxID=42636 RepID=UPI0020B21A51|nr:ubiquitin carboxyl-terminal hydrolase 47-like [Brienomyrus brachyistius]